jgi:hypothetical protein
MNKFQKLAITSLVAIFAAMILPATYSQNVHRTVINVPYAVQVNSTVLEPGQYVIRVLSPTEPNVVNIFSADEKTLIATITGLPVFRSAEEIDRAGSKTEFWFSAPASVRPRPVRAWFYPGEEQGVELVTSPAKKAIKSS